MDNKIMEIVMVKMETCYACELFEPTAKKITADRGVGFKTIKREEMPEGNKPSNISTFFII